MAIRSVSKSYNDAIKSINILTAYFVESKNLDARYQYLVSEVLMLRLFSILESAFADIAYKLACGAKYRNGNQPILLYQCANIATAHSVMLKHGRRQPLGYLKWTNVPNIEKNVKNVLDIRDFYFIHIQSNSNLIDEMRIVRNHIAHKSKTTRNDYLTALRRIIGANAKIPVGVFLTSVSTANIPRIQTYIGSSKIILDYISRGH